ncbi:carboxypeptidase-like regulatory domain-containing protein [Algoriphagus aestuariicola]|uniref:Carboxypeptidase-like regulatory domain-containing protein n=1 Tax=Algoriphagus aestuariicola TaxID=1852016 RepID=A0ABS3BMW0_9BACT|nr:carboxypeptidase-like regulatory domain-containing protein [Algoriphagus aestuariicola]MBN7800652.1 carboxypeptidase-like regulatory domain-containing protein [Algoriphagus aestuariicola]
MIAQFRLVGFITCILLVICSFSKAQNFQLKGRILDFDTKEYLEGAAVSLRNSTFADFTDGAGNFEIKDVATEKYVLVVTASGYNTFEKTIQLQADLDLGNLYLVKYGSEGTGAALQKTIRATNVSRLLVERPNLMGNAIYGIPPEPKKVEGNFYLDNKWNVASILLYREQTVLEGFRVRYNINSNTFELMEPEKNLVTTMPGLRIQNIVWMDSTYKVPRYFVNGMDFRDEGVPISGFFEVIVEGQLPLMRRTIAVFKESNYNTALMVGNRNDQIIKRNVYYYLKGKDLFEVPKKRKDLFPIFGEKAEEMENFVSTNEIDLKKTGSIFQLFTYYNSLFPGFIPIMDQLLGENDQ